MKLLFRILLLQRSKDQGFTLPMVIGIGLIMVLLSSISLLQASEENLTAISKTQSSTSLAMAELGVSRYRELLNNNRVLAVNSLDNWVAVANQTCDAITNGTGADGWSNTNVWRPVTVDETAPTTPTDFNGDGDTIDVAVPIGNYRIVEYRYQNDNNVTDDDLVDVDGNYTDPGEDGIFDQTADAANPNGPRGILTVQGQAPGSDSIAQIQVTIPIGVNIDDLDTLDPGIWIHNETITNWGTINLQDSDSPPNRTGNIVLYRQAPGATGCDDLDTSALGGGGNTVTAPVPNVAIRDPRDLPPLITLPTDTTKINPLVENIPTELIIGKPSDKSTKIDSNGNEDTDGTKRYYYEVAGTLDIDAGERLITDGTARVIVYVNGNLDVDSGGAGDVTDITNSSNDATSRFLEIHVTGDVNISGSGTVNIKGLIHAPNGQVDITGGPTVNLIGSIWADSWSNTGTVNVTTSEYEHYSITPQRTPKPLTFAPTGWEQQEATN
ncbi:MAG: hypothetical protein AAGA80_15975 [Cyanobacteria bacterium P01_F01_bin.143]